MQTPWDHGEGNWARQEALGPSENAGDWRWWSFGNGPRKGKIGLGSEFFLFLYLFSFIILFFFVLNSNFKYSNQIQIFNLNWPCEFNPKCKNTRILNMRCIFIYLFICYLTILLPLSEYAQSKGNQIIPKTLLCKYMYLFFFYLIQIFRALHDDHVTSSGEVSESQVASTVPGPDCWWRLPLTRS
jgi:hypothetical protein